MFFCCCFFVVFLGDGGCGASTRSRIIKLEKPCVGINMV